MSNYRTLSEVSEEYFRQHPEEIDSFISLIFEEYAEDGDTGALLSSLRVISRVKGISVLAEQTGMSRQGLQKALSSKGNPRLDNISAILRALGYRLVPKPIETLPKT